LRRKCEAAQLRRRRAEERLLRAEAERARRDLEQLEETELERSRRAAETQRRLTEAIQQEEEARRQQVEHDTAVNNAFNILTLHVASIGERLCNDMVSVCLSVCPVDQQQRRGAGLLQLGHRRHRSVATGPAYWLQIDICRRRQTSAAG